ncbi:hypothetical protein [Streptomyces sp. DHE17-7]|uniref:hypothetical protein n=1 Tax=Streptomyces sp. DHE17-7 TaxID=2759949 RepID=UPI0022EA545C|nr:hypothetical protein [Streptomyces sp. DHE17-7]MBJ6623665.1 hypothetical protein [Streptomyces sp. DHE17-7]
MGHHDAETIRQAVDLLRAENPAESVLAAAVTPLSDAVEVAEWMNAAALHTAGHPYCCRSGAIGCPYAGQAIRRARRIIAAAEDDARTSARGATGATPQNSATASASGSDSDGSSSGETNSSSAPAGA